MGRSLSVLILFLAYCSFKVAAITTISTFIDSGCQKSWRVLEGPNGYPDGLCTLLNNKGQFGSFQVVGLDPGCSVTIYGADTTSDPCSATVKQVAQFATCYNTSWVYYSIDVCTNPDLLQTSSSASLLVATSTTTLTTSTSTTIPNFPSIPANTVSSVATKDSGTQSNGAMIGGVIGGVAFGCTFITILFYLFYRRYKRPPKPPPKARTPRGELPDNGLLEADPRIPSHAYPRYELNNHHDGIVLAELPSGIEDYYHEYTRKTGFPLQEEKSRAVAVVQSPSELYGSSPESPYWPATATSAATTTTINNNDFPPSSSSVSPYSPFDSTPPGEVSNRAGMVWTNAQTPLDWYFDDAHYGKYRAYMRPHIDK